MVTETVDSRVPDGHEPLYEEGFAQGYPDIVDDQITAKEIRKLQVLDLSDGLGMFTQSSEQYRAGGHAQPASSACPRRDSFADVDRSLEKPVAISFGYGSISRVVPHVVDSKDASANEPVFGRQ